MPNLDMPLLVDLTLRAFLVMFAILLGSRIFGLRSFSKMSGFDFSITVAFGAVLSAAMMDRSQSIWVPFAAIAALFIWQMAMSPLRQRFGTVARAIDNMPLLLMEDGRILAQNLKLGGMTRDDLWAKLREANVTRLDEVRIAVLEATGEVSVVYGTEEISPELLENVRR